MMFEDSHVDEILDEWPGEDDENDLIPCPSCGAAVYEDAEQCPSCGDYIVHVSSIWNDRPLWWVLLAIAGIIAVILVLSGLTT